MIVFQDGRSAFGDANLTYATSIYLIRFPIYVIIHKETWKVLAVCEGSVVTFLLYLVHINVCVYK